MIGFLACFAATGSAQEKDPTADAADKPRVSLVARASPELRAYFRDRHGGKMFDDNLSGNLMSRMLDDQIDDFVKRVVEKNQRLGEAAAKLAKESDRASRLQWIRQIRETANDLEDTLRIWSDSLRATRRGKDRDDLPEAVSPAALVDQVMLYQTQIDQFLFPEQVSVSVKELQSEGFHGTLKRIQRMALTLVQEK